MSDLGDDHATLPQATYPRMFNALRSRQLRIEGLKRRRFVDVYHRMMQLSWAQFGLLWVAIYLAVNLSFAVLYWLLPGGVAAARPGSFTDAFFFSVQTLGTIGYGDMWPRSLAANGLVTVEAFFSISLTAVATGLIFARVSRPTARVMFSRVAVVTTLNGKTTLMFRAANVRANQVVEAEVTVSLARTRVTLEGVTYRGFFPMATVRSRTPLFVLSWSIMHVIDEDSPLWGADHASLLAEQAELIVVLSGTDETFAQRIHARHSYLPHEIIWGRRLADILSLRPDGVRVMDYSRFHDLEPHAP